MTAVKAIAAAVALAAVAMNLKGLPAVAAVVAGVVVVQAVLGFDLGIRSPLPDLAARLPAGLGVGR